MRKYVLAASLTLVTLHSFAQDVKTLERLLQHTLVNDLKKIRSITNQIYKLDRYNTVATYFICTSYRTNDYPDSVTAHFNKLRQRDPEHPAPYVLSAMIEYPSVSPSDTAQLEQLKIALRLDSTYVQGRYMLGVSYYDLFLQQPTRFYAASSRIHFKETLRYDSTRASELKYPIIQISSYLEDAREANRYRSLKSEPSNALFPLPLFLELPDNWETNYSLDVLYELRRTSFVVNWYSEQLTALQETALSGNVNKNVFRFTWLRSFHPPVAVRLERNGDTVMLYWKQAAGTGGYGPGTLTADQSKELTLGQWKGFMALLKSIDFWNAPTRVRTSGLDGARWIIEGVESGKYHVVDRWTPGGDFQKCGLYLLNLTDLKIKKKDIY